MISRAQFDQSFHRLPVHFAKTLSAYQLERYFQLFEDIHAIGNLDTTIQRAIHACHDMPSPEELYAIFQDLTYWTPFDFEEDWRRAYYECTGQLYDVVAGGKDFDPKKRREMDYWVTAGKEILRRFAFEKGGRKAVRSILKDYAARGYLVGRTMTEFLDDVAFGPVDGWQPPEREKVFELDPRVIARKTNLKEMPKYRADLDG